MKALRVDPEDLSRPATYVVLDWIVGVAVEHRSGDECVVVRPVLGEPFVVWSTYSGSVGEYDSHRRARAKAEEVAAWIAGMMHNVPSPTLTGVS